jgi:Na+-transporting methylmalonyl-CoA/oxaloacetate decarboxylase gamma subunit
MVAKKIIGLIVSIVALVASVIVGFFFFGAVAVAVLGIVVLFFILSFLVYLNRRWKYIVAWFHEKFNKSKSIKKKKGRWHSDEEVVVAKIEEK